MIVQPYFDIPPDIEAGLLSGDLIRYGGVVRDNLGKLVKHLKEVPGPETSQERVGRVAASLKKPSVIIAATAVSMVAAAVAAVAMARKRKQADNREMPECVTKYNNSLRAYLESVRIGSLDAGIIDRLISDLDALKEYSENGRITVDFSTEQSENLVQLVVDYTRQLAEANSVDLNEAQEPAPGSESGGVVDLRRYLEIQRQVFDEAA